MFNPYKTKMMTELNKKYKPYNPHYNEHELEVFRHFIISGKTGAGKTASVINLISTMKKCFAKIIIYTPNLKEPLYLGLKQKLEDQVEINLIDEIPLVIEHQNPDFEQRLIIIDDFITQPKSILKIIDDYAMRGRQQKMTCCFLTQQFYKCSTTIRANCSYLVLLKIADKRNLSLIVSTIASDIKPDIIKRCIKNAVKYNLNICCINLNDAHINKTIKRNFKLDYYILEDENEQQISNPVLFEGSGLVN